MRRTKLITFLLAACMVLSLCVPAMAAGTVLKVEQPEKLPAVGETFTVTVSIEGNPGISAVQMSLLYDSKIVKCTKIQTGQALQDMMSDSNPVADMGKTAAIVAAISITPTDNNG